MDRFSVPDDLPRAPLAGVRPFRAGPLLVEPALLTVSAGGTPQRLEPRVMHVLVVLHEARGEVVPRDALIRHCWGGRAVTEDSVQRCVALLRKLARGIEPAPFVIETIPKVGYRLVAASAAGAAADQSDAGAAAEPPSAGSRAGPSLLWRLAGTRVLALLAIVALAGMAAAMGAVSGQNHVAPDGPPLAVAILPIEVFGGTPEIEAFARAWPYALANDLKAAGLQVAMPRPEAGGESAGARRRVFAYLVDGAVLPGAGGAKIIVRIAERESGEVLWSKAFSGSGQLQDLVPEMSAWVGSALTGPAGLSGERRPGGGRRAAKRKG